MGMDIYGALLISKTDKPAAVVDTMCLSIGGNY